jgi:hypothetical protein
MAKPQEFKDPPFVIRPAKNGMSWSVLLVSGRGHSKEISEFASEKSAQSWIGFQSKSWLKKYKAARHN